MLDLCPSNELITWNHKTEWTQRTNHRDWDLQINPDYAKTLTSNFTGFLQTHFCFGSVDCNDCGLYMIPYQGRPFERTDPTVPVFSVQTRSGFQVHVFESQKNPNQLIKLDRTPSPASQSSVRSKHEQLTSTQHDAHWETWPLRYEAQCQDSGTATKNKAVIQSAETQRREELA